MAKKSAAQIKRLEARAVSRGETYVRPPVEPDLAPSEKSDAQTRKQAKTESRSDTPASTKKAARLSKEDAAKLQAVLLLQKELQSIDGNADLKAKDRRSAKRKAEAIALESSGCSAVDELHEWFKSTGQHLEQHEDVTSKKSEARKDGDSEKKRANPYIAFIGQLAFDTTKEQLFEHLRKNLEDDFKVTSENVKIRLLQDAKTKKSRGMAFVEVKDDPELLYALLKLHHTHLDGRRINVERTAGGGNDTRKAKIKHFREEQVNHMDATVKAMLEEYYKRGEIQESGEIDDGVIQLCKRHSATVVQAALERYVESNGRDMDNPSAYLTFLLGKLAEEGIYNDRDKDEKGKGKAKSPSTGGKEHRKSERIAGKKRPESKTSERPSKQQKVARSSSEFTKRGIDMSISDKSGDMADIFPSLSRGRGRGRGYM